MRRRLRWQLPVSGLFQTHVVLDRLHAVDRARDFNGPDDVRPGADEAAGLDEALEGLDIDFGRFQGRFVEYRRLDLGCDDGIIDVFAGGLVF